MIQYIQFLRCFVTEGFFESCDKVLHGRGVLKFKKSVRGRLQRTSGKWGGGGFEISDIPGRGVVCESSDVRKFLKKSKFQNFSELFKVKTRNYNRSRFQYESIHI